MKNTNVPKTYCLPKLTTPDRLETHLMGSRGTALTYGDHTCEDEISLTAIAPETFEDNGHAIACAISKAN